MNTKRVVFGIFKNQVKDVFKNIQTLFLFFIFPIIGVVMTTALPSEAEQTGLFISIFASIHCIFTPISISSSIISEEKEKNTLRVLIMSNVKPVEYLISIGGFVFLATMLSACSFIFIGGYGGSAAVSMLLFMGVGTLCSILIGMSFGVYSKNMMSANGIAIPVAMVFGFLPMLATFNEKIMQFARFTFGVQVSKVLSNPANFLLDMEMGAVILINFLIFLTVFVVAFRKYKLD